MRTAFYHPSAVPPRQWLSLAALFWERIHLSELVVQVLRDHPEYVAANADAAVLFAFITETDICTWQPPAAVGVLPPGEGDEWDDYLLNATRSLENMLLQEDIPVTERKVPSVPDLIRVATLMNQMLLHERFAAVFPGIDFFFADRAAFVGTCPRQNMLMRSVEAFVPRLPSTLSVARITAFRADTTLQRQRFREALEVELARFEMVSAESDFVLALRRVTDVLQEQLELLQVRCRQHRVEIVKRTFGLTLAAPAVLQVLGSALAVPFLQPAAIAAVLSLAAADYLAARERHQVDLRSAPWAYLMSLRSLR